MNSPTQIAKLLRANASEGGGEPEEDDIIPNLMVGQSNVVKPFGVLGSEGEIGSGGADCKCEKERVYVLPGRRFKNKNATRLSGVFEMSSETYLFRRRRASPSRPSPRAAMDAGSGTTA